MLAKLKQQTEDSVMAEGDEIPFRFTFEGIQPIDGAFHDTVQLPVERWEQIKGKKRSPLPDGLEGPPIRNIDLQLCWEEDVWSLALLELHCEESEDLRQFAERISKNLGDSPEAKHITAILCIGVVAGRREAKILETYTRQGLDDLRPPIE